MAGTAQVDDRETSVAESDRPLHVSAAFVRASMRKKKTGRTRIRSSVERVGGFITISKVIRMPLGFSAP
jgi:hypothetical protein